MLRQVCMLLCALILIVPVGLAQTMSVGSGPYAAITEGDPGAPDHSIYRPKDLSPFSKTNPLMVLAWGNGGCSSSSQMHANFLAEVASHGVLVVALGPFTASGGGSAMGMMGGGSGTKSAQLLEALDWATKENKREDGKYYQKVDLSKFAVAGMSCGGLQALEVSTDPRIKTTLVMNSGILNSSGGAPGAGAPGGGMMRGGAPGAGAPGTGAPGAGAPGGGMPGGGMMRGGAPGAGAPGTGAPGAGAPGGGMPGGGMAGGGMPGGGMAGGGMRGGAPGAGAPGAGARGGGGGGMMAMPSLSKDFLKKLHAPIIYIIGGSTDIAFANAADDFAKIDVVPVAMVNLEGVGHGGTYSQPNGGEFGKVAVAWLKWQLKKDETAKKMFSGEDCGLCKDTKWKYEKKKI
jgi:hypothetical protein